MTEHIFITQTGNLNPHWRAVFPSAVACLSSNELSFLSDSSIIWLEWPSQPDTTHYQELEKRVSSHCPVVVLSPTPNVEQARTVISIGAKGYCHALASPTQLKEVEVVVSHGGLWLGRELLQALTQITHSASKGANSLNHAQNELHELSRRENDVAQLVAQGYTNQEVGTRLHISDHTVKTHLSNIFKKLDIRDRVQLTLYINRHS